MLGIKKKKKKKRIINFQKVVVLSAGIGDYADCTSVEG